MQKINFYRPVAVGVAKLHGGHVGVRLNMAEHSLIARKAWSFVRVLAAQIEETGTKTEVLSSLILCCIIVHQDEKTRQLSKEKGDLGCDM